MIDPTRNERAAIMHGAAMAGEYLDSLSRTDLTLLSTGEWHTLIEVIVTGYCNHLWALAAQDRSRSTQWCRRCRFEHHPQLHGSAR